MIVHTVLDSMLILCLLIKKKLKFVAIQMSGFCLDCYVVILLIMMYLSVVTFSFYFSLFKNQRK